MNEAHDLNQPQRQRCIILLYTHVHIIEILRNNDEIQCVFTFSYFHRCLAGLLLNPANTQNVSGSHSNCNVKKEKQIYNKKKIQFFLIILD
jgi:hypothetical protein